jgi:hypothetical protein
MLEEFFGSIALFWLMVVYSFCKCGIVEMMHDFCKCCVWFLYGLNRCKALHMWNGVWFL